MPQISLYVDKKTLDLVERMAKNSHKSIFKWVSDQLKTSVKETWPDNYFSNFGALAKVDFPDIEELRFEDDSHRERI